MNFRLTLIKIMFKIFRNSKSYTKMLLKILLTNGNLKKNQKLETKNFSIIELIENGTVIKKAALPKGLNIENFVYTLDSVLGVEGKCTDRYTYYYTWEK